MVWWSLFSVHRPTSPSLGPFICKLREDTIVQKRAMPPKKKRSKASPPSAPKVPDEPMEYVNQIRENAGKCFTHAGKKKDVNYDIRALKINAEIFPVVSKLQISPTGPMAWMAPYNSPGPRSMKSKCAKIDRKAAKKTKMMTT